MSVRFGEKDLILISTANTSRIYVGSINFEFNEAMLKQSFLAFGPVKAVSLTFDPVTNRHKGFAFLEFETPEAAQLSIEQMNGVILGGRNVKVRGERKGNREIEGSLAGWTTIEYATSTADY